MSSIQSYLPHRLALLVPPMNEDEYKSLKEDIDKNGQRFPITLWDNFILDGIHRQRACDELGINVQTESWNGTEEESVRFILSANLHRRHLSTGQRAMIANELAQQVAGGDRKSENHSANSQNDFTQTEALILPLSYLPKASLADVFWTPATATKLSSRRTK